MRQAVAKLAQEAVDDGKLPKLQVVQVLEEESSLAVDITLVGE
jgi:hypothetical protein